MLLCVFVRLLVFGLVLHRYPVSEATVQISHCALLIMMIQLMCIVNTYLRYIIGTQKHERRHGSYPESPRAELESLTQQLFLHRTRKQIITHKNENTRKRKNVIEAK